MFYLMKKYDDYKIIIDESALEIYLNYILCNIV